LIPVTTEECWAFYKTSSEESVTEVSFSKLKPTAMNLGYWDQIRELKKNTNSKLELLRESKKLGSSLEAELTLKLDKETMDKIKYVDLAEVLLVSEVNVLVEEGFDLSNADITVSLSTGYKCERCWKYENSHKHEDKKLCLRCEKVIES
jgi:isoleucyl-tRNA synthetase